MSVMYHKAERETHLRWNQGFFLQQCFNLWRANHIVLLIDELVCSDDLVPSLLGVPTHKNLALKNILICPKIMYAILGNDASRAWACTKVVNICYQNSRNVSAR